MSLSLSISELFISLMQLVNGAQFLKLVSAIFYKSFIFSLNDSPSKTMKNVFYFI